jgi:hypothetical protein
MKKNPYDLLPILCINLYLMEGHRTQQEVYKKVSLVYFQKISLWILHFADIKQNTTALVMIK